MRSSRKPSRYDPKKIAMVPPYNPRSENRARSPFRHPSGRPEPEPPLTSSHFQRSHLTHQLELPQFGRQPTQEKHAQETGTERQLKLSHKPTTPNSSTSINPHPHASSRPKTLRAEITVDGSLTRRPQYRDALRKNTSNAMARPVFIYALADIAAQHQRVNDASSPPSSVQMCLRRLDARVRLVLSSSSSPEPSTYWLVSSVSLW